MIMDGGRERAMEVDRGVVQRYKRQVIVEARREGNGDRYRCSKAQKKIKTSSNT